MNDPAAPTVSDVEAFLLQNRWQNMLGNLGVGRHGIVADVLRLYPGDTKPRPETIMEAVWGLISKGYAYIDISNDSGSMSGNHADPKNWLVRPTKRGLEFDSSLPNPDLPDKFLQSFAENIPGVSEKVRLYVKEALCTYNNRTYIAAAVMLGVAAEAAFLEMAVQFCAYLPSAEAENFRKYLKGPSYSVLLDEFRKRFESRKKDFGDLGDKIDLQLHSVLDLIRNYRNDSGHPTGFQMDRATCHQSLVVFANTARRLYALKAAFEAKSGATL